MGTDKSEKKNTDKGIEIIRKLGIRSAAPRYSKVEVVGDPVRVKSCFVKGFQELPVRLHAL